MLDGKDIRVAKLYRPRIGSSHDESRVSLDLGRSAPANVVA